MLDVWMCSFCGKMRSYFSGSLHVAVNFNSLGTSFWLLEFDNVQRQRRQQRRRQRRRSTIQHINTTRIYNRADISNVQHSIYIVIRFAHRQTISHDDLLIRWFFCILTIWKWEKKNTRFLWICTRNWTSIMSFTLEWFEFRWDFSFDCPIVWTSFDNFRLVFFYSRNPRNVIIMWFENCEVFLTESVMSPKCRKSLSACEGVRDRIRMRSVHSWLRSNAFHSNVFDWLTQDSKITQWSVCSLNRGLRWVASRLNEFVIDD